MSVSKNMTASTLNALKGWPSMHAVDFTALLDASVTVDPVPEGSVVHLSATGTYLLGVGSSNVMPLFTFQSSDDPDVMNDYPDPATVKGNYVPINPTGELMALVASGAYELVSTAFDTTTDAADYPPNTPLTSVTGNGAQAGRLAPGTMYTDMIVGLVSRGMVDNGYGFDAVAFWPFPVFPGGS
jgi:hypothetical protein